MIIHDQYSKQPSSPRSERKSHFYQGSLTGFPADGDFTSQSQDAFPDPGEAKRLGVENPFFHDPDAVVSHFEYQTIVRLFQAHKIRDAAAWVTFVRALEDAEIAVE
jgi:hypothetical protein